MSRSIITLFIIFLSLFSTTVTASTQPVRPAVLKTGGTPKIIRDNHPENSTAQNIKPIKFHTLSNKALFEKAVNIYIKAKNSGDYLKSAKLFSELSDRSISHEELFYNMGNAYYKAGMLGYAVFNYERALKLSPNHSNANYNLNLTHKVISSRFKDSVVSFGENPIWIKMATWLHYQTLAIFFFTLWIAFFIFLTITWLRKKGITKIILITTVVLLGILASSFGLLFAGRLYYEKAYKYGIVLPDEMTVREAPQQAANSSFKLHAGLKVRIGSEERSWIKIKLPNGMEGWVEKSQIGRL